MNAIQSVTNGQLNSGLFRRAERSAVLLRIEFAFEGGLVLHGTVDNASFDGLFANCHGKPCDKMVGREGVCRVFLGTDYMEIPCRVARVIGGGLGIHLKEGYDEEYNRVVGRVQDGDAPEMGLDINFTEVGVHGQVVREVHPGH